MKLFAFFHGRGPSGARLVRVDAVGAISLQARNEMRERLRELAGKAEQKRRLRNLQTVSRALLQRLTDGREQTDEGDQLCPAA